MLKLVFKFRCIMVKKSKRYINKGQSVTFQLVDKPHADPSGFEADNVRVWHATSDEKRKEEQLACGIYFEDDYDYTRHLRDRFGEGTRDQEEKAVPLWEEIEEGQFDDVVSVKSSKSKGERAQNFVILKLQFVTSVLGFHLLFTLVLS